MAEQTAKSVAKVAWAITVAAIVDLIAFFMLVKANVSLLLLSAFGLSEVGLILFAVYAWKSLYNCRISCKREGQQ